MKQDVELRGPGGPCLRTGQVAEQAGVNVQTLRYYERRGLIAEPARSPGGHRSYPPETIALLTVIKAAQRLGFTLEEVAELLDTGRRGHPTPDLRARAQAKIVEVAEGRPPRES
ncbi:MerR family transcriptional regulator [Microbispora sp. NBC_01189]|uniref:MerR family transcriptional regulator n=1 Tax=Microbispora sp. NBC_01189 TaxID=2903583 RepID=UPI002E139589|nr:MerR family transcriptional regulator [Microbispora sp. NBC_01189]